MTATAHKPNRARVEASSSGPAGTESTRRSQRRRQLPWISLGVLLVTTSILGFALWSMQQGERTDVLVAARSIDVGQVIGRGDLTTVAVGADPGINTLEPAQTQLLLGSRALGPIPAGTPFSQELVTDAEALPPGMAVVGAALSAGEYPTSRLRSGDLVRLVRVASKVASDDSGVLVIGEARIWTIEDLSGATEPRLFISLLVDEELSPEVANAVSTGQLRLVLVGAPS
jgi:SAF domain